MSTQVNATTVMQKLKMAEWPQVARLGHYTYTLQVSTFEVNIKSELVNVNNHVGVSKQRKMPMPLQCSTTDASEPHHAQTHGAHGAHGASDGHWIHGVC